MLAESVYSRRHVNLRLIKMKMTLVSNLCIIAFILCIRLKLSQAFIEDLYCGMENCYDVLGVDRDTDRVNIAKAYRTLARKFHPDMHKSAEAKKEYEVKFRAVANAYEILRDDDSRKDYDYMLDNPDEVYSHYFHYYRRRLSPRVDVRIVIAVALTLISAFQYYSGWQRYKMAIDYFSSTEKYRKQALLIAEKECLFPESPKGKYKKSKDEIKQEKEAIIRRVIQEKMDIKGACEKPSVQNILWIQLLLLPISIFYYIKWYFRWIWKFNIKREDYGAEEKYYMIRKNLGFSQLQFDGLEELKKEEFLAEELWLKPTFLKWKEIEDEEARRRSAEDPRLKRYRRYMKNHGTGQITFED